MRIVAGEAGGRRLRAPAGSATRPTAGRVRESIFARFGPWLRGRHVLDLFAGSGALGIEALSRGAASATFVESARPALAALTANLRELGFEPRARVLARPVERAWPALSGQTFDLALMDPPYGKQLVPLAVEGLLSNSLLGPDAVIVAVHATRDEPPPLDPKLWTADTRRMGDSALTTYVRAPEDQAP